MNNINNLLVNFWVKVQIWLIYKLNFKITLIFNSITNQTKLESNFLQTENPAIHPHMNSFGQAVYSMLNVGEWSVTPPDYFKHILNLNMNWWNASIFY